MATLSDRQRNILFRVIDEFIMTGEPVASSTVAKSGEVRVSSATVRNDMARLEEMGYLHQPHTSAGRVPTAAGTRRYVNYLYSQRHRLDASLRQAVDHQFGPGDASADDLVRRAGEMISKLSRLTSIASLTNLESVRLSEMSLSTLGGNRVLALLIAQDGRIFKRVVRLDETLEPVLLNRIQNYLSELVAGRTLAQVRQRVATERAAAARRYRDYVARALEIGHQAIEAAGGAELHVEGTVHILDVDEIRQDAGRLRGLLGALEEKERVLALLDKIYEARNAQALIGPELGWDLGDDLSLIFCGFYRGGERMGVIGLLGPMRMDYARIIPLVDHTAHVLSEELDSSV